MPKGKACPSMLASIPAGMVNHKAADLGIPNRFKLNASRSRLWPSAAIQQSSDDGFRREPKTPFVASFDEARPIKGLEASDARHHSDLVDFHGKGLLCRCEGA